MATMTNDTTNNLWVLEQTATGAGTFTDLLTTENKFLDKNISIKSTIPAASGPALAITDKGSTNITIGTASGGYYPLTTSLTGKLTVSSAGWITTDGFSATDSTVTVGRIAQSTLKNGTTAINSGATITPSVTDTQTINISAGYNAARTVKIAPMSSGTAAAASVTISGTATKPTLVNTSSTISGKTQVNVSGITELTADIDTDYYVALTVDAPATTPTFTKNITTAGYLGPVGAATNTQIATEGSISAKNQLYFAELVSGEISIGGNSSTVGSLTISKYNTDGSANGKNVNSVAFTASNASTTEPTSGNYVAVQVKVPAVTITPTVTLTTAGWVGNVNQITKNNVTSNGSTTQIYIPLTSGVLTEGNGVVDASSGNITLGTKTTTQPSSGKYITVTGSGSVSVGTGGYLAKDTSKSSNTATAYYPIYAITASDFTVTDNVIKSNKAGWLDNNLTVATINTGSLKNTPTTGHTYTEVSSPAILTNDGFLYIDQGYFGDTKISLGTLIPDSDTTDVVDGALRIGYEAFDTAGQRIVGGLATYDGTYSVVGWTVAT